ncbi:MAG: rhodanese-like domain-containing protein [Selenomonadaceae bacterium]|nr:rhodanese-like domain-containing protein [Selenomonadaceae bacterium]
MKKILATLMILIVALCAGCGGEKITYKSLTHDEAIKMIGENPNVIVLDVRTPDEYEKKHIPNAILVPLEELREGNFASLPDKNQTILIYCWTGRRAQDSAQILVDKGYKNVYEFGGIADWKGPIVNGETYKTISQEEAMEILVENPNARLLDCRFPKDYELRHIPNAIHYPLEAAVADNFEKIPDKDAPLITYCGDGNRGRLTAKVLVEKGYTNVYTMGGIIDWKGPVEGTAVEEQQQ